MSYVTASIRFAQTLQTFTNEQNELFKELIIDFINYWIQNPEALEAVIENHHLDCIFNAHFIFINHLSIFIKASLWFERH